MTLRQAAVILADESENQRVLTRARPLLTYAELVRARRALRVALERDGGATLSEPEYRAFVQELAGQPLVHVLRESLAGAGVPQRLQETGRAVMRVLELDPSIAD